jgi:hypothetical protein
MRLAPAGLLLALAACGPTPRAPTPVAPPSPAPPPAVSVDAAPLDPLGIDWSTLDYHDDDHALAVWDRLALTGDNWQQRLSLIPDDASALREALARSLLRQGNFACPSTEVRLDCDRTVREFTPVSDTASLTDPCLRRELAFWALDQLDSTTLQTELAADLISLAGLPSPEEELNRAALARVDDETLRLQMLDAIERAGNEVVADESLGNLSQTGLEHAALQLHIDGAVDVLDATESPSFFASALLSTGLRRDTRVKVARDLANVALTLPEDDPSRAQVFSALEAATRDADCALAGAATASLATARGRAVRLLPKKPDARAYRHAFCAALHSGVDTDWQPFLGAFGLVVDNEEPDDSGTPARTIERIKLADLTSLPFSSDLAAALPHCAPSATECRVPGTGTTLTLHWKRAGSRLVLDKVTRRERPGC